MLAGTFTVDFRYSWVLLKGILVPVMVEKGYHCNHRHFTMFYTNRHFLLYARRIDIFHYILYEQTEGGKSDRRFAIIYIDDYNSLVHSLTMVQKGSTVKYYSVIHVSK